MIGSYDYDYRFLLRTNISIIEVIIPLLEKLTLGGNGLSYLPESFDHLVNLTDLNLNNNQFTSFPEAILRLPNLKTLWLGKKQVGFSSRALWGSCQPQKFVFA